MKIIVKNLLVFFFICIPLIGNSQDRETTVDASQTVNDDNVTVVEFESNRLEVIANQVIQTKSVSENRLKAQTLRSINNVNLSHIPTSHTVDRSRAVGEIIIEQGNGAMGSLSYNVPLDIYPGRMGFQPSISLSYNSHSGNGVAGMGWDIGGLSAISATINTLYFDGFTGSNKLNSSGAFTLDGIRLIFLNNGANNTISYETERGNIKVTAYTNKGIIKSFKAYYPSGQIGHYGSGTNDAGELKYPLVKLEDAYGNFIDYIYSKRNNCHNLIQINYGGIKLTATSNRAHFASIMFYYDNREDITPLYFNGLEMKQDALLNQIETYFEDNLVRSYSLLYTFDKVSLLDRIECFSNGEYLNPLYFYYGESYNQLEFEKDSTEIWQFVNPEETEISYTNARFKPEQLGSGLIMYPAYKNYDLIKEVKDGWTGNKTYLYGSKFPENQQLLVYGDITDSYSKPFNLLAGKGFIQLLPISTNGSDTDQLLKINSNQNGGIQEITYQLLQVEQSLGAYSGKFLSTFTVSHNESVKDGSQISPPFRFFLCGDFKGEGKNMIMTISGSLDFKGNSRQSRLSIVDLESKAIVHDVPFPYKIGTMDSFFVMDYNGDGKTDLAFYSFSGGLHVLTLDENNNFVLIAHEGNFRMSDVQPILLGDINGDGKTDILSLPYQNGGKDWKIYYSDAKSDGFSVVEYAFIHHNSTTNNYVLQDMNGDGKSDLVVKNKNLVSIYLSENGRLNTIAESKTINVDEKSKLISINTSINQKTSQLLSINGTKLSFFNFTRNDLKQQKLTGVISSNGLITKHTYQNAINSYYGVYERGATLNYPYSNLSGDIMMLSSSKSYLNNELIASFSYTYHKGVIDRRGRGFIGFERTEISDNIREIATIQKYDAYNFGSIERVETPRNIESYKYSIKIAPNKIAKSLLTGLGTKDLLNNTSVLTLYEYDTYGNTVRELVNYGGGILKDTKTRLYNVDYNGLYLLGIPLEKTVTNIRSGKAITHKVVQLYNEKYIPRSKVSYYNDKVVSEENYEYDKYWNITAKHSKSFNSPVRFSHIYEYDDYGNLEKEYDPLKLYVTYEYDYTGQLSLTKNHKDQITRFEYDKWGRKIKTTYPDASVETVKLEWVSSSSPSGALIVTTQSKTGKASEQIFTDALGRKIRKGEMRFDGKYLYTDMIYDEFSRLKKNSLPFKGSSPVKWNNYLYDEYDRILEVNYASGKKDSYSYNRQMQTSVIDGVKTTKITDLSGQIAYVIDPAGAIQYNLDPDNQPTSITAPGNIKTTIEYDVYGRQISITDPSVGKKSYSYDNAGNLSQETDANGRIIKYTYDNYDRLIKKDFVGDFYTQYIYNSDGLITEESSSNNSKVEFVYDNLMRYSSTKVSIMDGKWMQKTFKYTDGNIASIAYKSQSGDLLTENFYYSNGKLSERKINAATSVWKLTGENDMGLASTAQTGSLNRYYSYDAYGLPTGRSAKRGTSFVQDMSYSINPLTGNLNWRKDNIRGKNEDFVYDHLNRLTHFSGKVMSYDVRGNITENSGIGKFEYEPDNPYALAMVTPYGKNIPARQQVITYNSMLRAKTIFENKYLASFDYSSDGDRLKMRVQNDGVEMLKRYYLAGQYEVDEGTAGNSERLYLGGDANTASAVYMKQGSGVWSVYYICRDYLGSITHVTNADGTLKQELSYDPWGRLRNPDTHSLYAVDSEPALFLNRGYTGHEHLPLFGLINMNARLYDPLLGRFLSADPYIQAGWMTQNFNRYSYALNNPLRFTDPSGEIIPFLIVAGVAFTAAYITHGIVTGEWGRSAIQTGLIAGGTSVIAFYAMGGVISTYNACVFAGKDVANQILSSVIPPLNLQFGDFGLTISPIAMLTAGIGTTGLKDGFRFGAGISASQKVGDFTFVGGGSLFNGGSTLHGGFVYDDGKQGFSFIANKYKGANDQVTGTVGYRNGKFSVKHENDLFGKFVGAGKHDRFRTAALELEYKNISAGFSIYTNDPTKDEFGIKEITPDYSKNNKGIYKDGTQLASPFYIGVRQGRSIAKIGINTPVVGWFQNALHRYISKDPDFHYGDYNNNFVERGIWPNSSSLFTY